jgi:hypothetical protein
VGGNPAYWRSDYREAGKLAVVFILPVSDKAKLYRRELKRDISAQFSGGILSFESCERYLGGTDGEEPAVG